MEIFINYVPNKYKSIDDQDPPWMNDRIKSKINKKTLSLSKMLRTTLRHMINLQFAITELSDNITERMSAIFKV